MTLLAGRLAAVLAIVLAGVGAIAAELEGTYVLPTEACGNFYFVRMEVGGDPDRVLSMLLDTGASHTVVDPEALERVSGQSVEHGRHARFAELKAGEIKFEGVRARVVQLDHLQLAIGERLDGILGFPTFRDLLLTIDYPRGEVRVRSGSLPRPDGKRILKTVKEKRRPFIFMTLDHHRRPVLLDSGAWGGFVLRSSDALPLVGDPVEYDSSLRIDRVMVKSGARLRGNVSLATATLARPTLELASSTELVGTTVLRNFSLTFDQKGRRVLFERSVDEPIEFPPVRDFGWSIIPRRDGWEILRVFDGFGAARAGLLAGDLVVAVDGTPVYERDRCSLEADPPPEIPLSIERDGQRLEFSVPFDTVVP